MHYKTLPVLILSLFTASFASAQQNAWTQTANKTTPVSHTAGVGLNGLLYVVGGTTSGTTNTTKVETYDPSLDAWALETTAPLALCDHAVTRSGSKIYVAGGRVTGNGAAIANMNSYDPVAKAWTPRLPMPTARFGGCAAFDNGTLYVIGGDTGSGVGGVYSGEVETYSTTTDTWTSKTPMTTPRRGAAAVVVGTEILVIGGENGAGVLTTVEAYDIAADTWSARAPLPSARTEAGVVVVNNIVYVVGGRNGTGGNTNTLYMYDYTTDQWLIAANLPFSVSGMAAGKVKGDLTIAGGTGATDSTAIYKAGAVQFVVSQSGLTSPFSPAGAVFATYGQPIINGFGHYAYQAKLRTGVAGVTIANAAGIWADHNSGKAKLIARASDIAPDANGAPNASGAFFSTFTDPVFDNNDKVAFIAKLAGNGVTLTNNFGIWTDASGGGTLKLVARMGAQAPGMPTGAVFGAFLSIALPDSGGVAFVATLKGVGVTATNNLGLWADDGSGNVSLVARKGTAVIVNGTQKIISALSVFPIITKLNAQTRGFNILADFVYRANFTDGSQAILHAVAP
jgi:N-acetylneuraminic acid mutarotase